jgi:hypothetical protein
MSLTDAYYKVYNKEIINEAVVDIKFNNPPEQKTLRMSDLYAKQLLGYAGRLTTNIEEHVIKWVKAANWGTQAQQFLVPSIIRALSESYDLNDIDVIKKLIKGIQNLYNNKENLTSFTESLIPDNNNFLTFFKNTITYLPSTKIFNNKDFIDKVIKFEFSESKVAVGPGEVFVTLFSEVVNPAKGDLYIPSIKKEIELKADGGRAGKSNVVQAANKSFKEIRKYIGSSLKQHKEELLDEIFDLVEPFRDIINQKNIVFNKIIKQLLNKDYSILKQKVLSQPSELKNIAKVGENVYSLELDNPELPSVIMDKLSEIGKLKEGGETLDFKSFFNVVDDTQAINMLSNFSPESNNNIKSVIRRYYNKLAPDQIVASLQINDYQQGEKFDYIIFFNQNNKNILTIGPFTNNYIYNLEMVLSVANRFNPSISTGGGRGGAQIYIK